MCWAEWWSNTKYNRMHKKIKRFAATPKTLDICNSSEFSQFEKKPPFPFRLTRSSCYWNEVISLEGNRVNMEKSLELLVFFNENFIPIREGDRCLKLKRYKPCRIACDATVCTHCI